MSLSSAAAVSPSKSLRDGAGLEASLCWVTRDRTGRALAFHSLVTPGAAGQVDPSRCVSELYPCIVHPGSPGACALGTEAPLSALHLVEIGLDDADHTVFEHHVLIVSRLGAAAPERHLLLTR